MEKFSREYKPTYAKERCEPARYKYCQKRECGEYVSVSKVIDPNDVKVEKS